MDSFRKRRSGEWLTYKGFTLNASDCLLIQHASPEYSAVLRLTEPFHRTYCDRHRICYQPTFDVKDVDDTRRMTWQKVKAIKEALEDGYKYVVYLDADTLIVGEEDLRNGCPENAVGLTWHELDWGDLAPTASDHLNVGTVFVGNGDRSLKLISDWWNSPPHDHTWAEQHSLNLLAKEYPKAVQAIDHKWNSTPPYFEAKDEVVRAWHGVFQPWERFEVMKSAVEGLKKGRRGKEGYDYQALIRSEALYRRLKFGLQPKGGERCLTTV